MDHRYRWCHGGAHALKWHHGIFSPYKKQIQTVFRVSFWFETQGVRIIPLGCHTLCCRYLSCLLLGIRVIKKWAKYCFLFCNSHSIFLIYFCIGQGEVISLTGWLWSPSQTTTGRTQVPISVVAQQSSIWPVRCCYKFGIPGWAQGHCQRVVPLGGKPLQIRNLSLTP